RKDAARRRSLERTRFQGFKVSRFQAAWDCPNFETLKPSHFETLLLSRPEPAERTRCQQRIYESVKYFLEYEAPRHPAPDAIWNASNSISQKRCGSDHAKNGQIISSRGHGVRRQVSYE